MKGKNWKMIWNIPRLAKKSWALMKNPKVGGSDKLLVVLLGLGYFLWPFDIIPDVPFIGQIDDLSIVFLLLNWFVNRSEPEVIETDYYFVDDKEDKDK